MADDVFTPATGYLDTETFPNPTSETEFRTQMNVLPMQILEFHNTHKADITQSKGRWHNLTPFLFGAIADGSSHPLSERYAELAAAQAVYAHATALTDEIDWCAIQAAINSATAPGKVFLPAAGYVINKPISGKTGMMLEGSGCNATFIYNSSAGDSIQFVYGSGPTEIYAEVSNMTITKLGSSTPRDGFNFTNCAYVKVKNVRVSFHTHATYFSFGEQHIFENCQLMSNTYGAYFTGASAGAASNYNKFINCQIGNTYGVYFNGYNYKNIFERCAFYSCTTATYSAVTAQSVWGNEFNSCWYEANTNINDLRSGIDFIFKNCILADNKPFIIKDNYGASYTVVENLIDLSNNYHAANGVDYELHDNSPVTNAICSQLIGGQRSFARDSTHAYNLVGTGLGADKIVTPSFGVGMGDKNLCTETNIANWGVLLGSKADSQPDPLGGTTASKLTAALLQLVIGNANGGEALTGVTFTAQVYALSNGGYVLFNLGDNLNGGASGQKRVYLPKNKYHLINFTYTFPAGSTGTELNFLIGSGDADVTLWYPVVNKGSTIIPLLPNSRDMSGYSYEVFGIKHNVRVYGTAAPVAGTWAAGDRVINTVPTVGQPKGWVCTVAGTPGTWISEGNL